MPASPASSKRSERVTGSVAVGLWCAFAAAALWWGRHTPPVPEQHAEQVEVAARKAAWIERDVKAWTSEHGDRLIPWDRAHGHLAIVIDDVGRELDAHNKLQALRHPLTFSVLPGSTYAAGAQLRLRDDPRRYREIWLHMPMEPIDGAQMHAGHEAEEEFMRTTDDPALLRAKLDRALARVPAAVGVNNHMGSKLTAEPAAMDVVAEQLAARDLLFLDSRTTAETVAADAAARAGVPVASRQVFLDHDPSPQAMQAALAEAVQRAKSEPIVAIGHPSPELAWVLEKGLEEAHAQGVGVYPLSVLIAHTHTPPAARTASVELPARQP